MGSLAENRFNSISKVGVDAARDLDSDLDSQRCPYHFKISSPE